MKVVAKSWIGKQVIYWSCTAEGGKGETEEHRQQVSMYGKRAGFYKWILIY